MRVLVQDEHLRRLARGLEHRLLVPRHEGTQVDDLDRDAVAVELLRRLLGGVDHRAPGDHAQIAALLVDARLAEWRLVALVRYLGLDSPVEVLVLEVEARVRILDCAREQPLRFEGRELTQRFRIAPDAFGEMDAETLGR